MRGTPHVGLVILLKVFPWQRLYCPKLWFYGEKKTVDRQLLKIDVVIGTCHFHWEKSMEKGFSAPIMG